MYPAFKHVLIGVPLLVLHLAVMGIILIGFPYADNLSTEIVLLIAFICTFISTAFGMRGLLADIRWWLTLRALRRNTFTLSADALQRLLDRDEYVEEDYDEPSTTPWNMER